jgi:pimeloyl-ACP methyl ester carboxylesterase
VQCTTIELPVDYANPASSTFKLRIGRVPASDPAHKKGVLLFPPGGPGAGIVSMFVANRAGNHVDDFRRWYDVVTFDPRGIGKSSPIRCSPQAVPKATPPSTVPPTQAQFDAISAANAAFFKTCFALTGGLMSHLSAMDTAMDVERIRQTLAPNAGLLAYGGSYGSAYGAAYLERYGSHVKALVLDGVVDHSVDLPTFMTRNVVAAQDEFDRLTRWCNANASCALHGRDVGAAYDKAVARAPALRTTVSQLLAAGSSPEYGWSFIARLLAQVNAGNMSELKKIVKSMSLGETSADPQLRAGKSGLFSGVFCSDYGPQRDYASFQRQAIAISRRAPRFAWKFWDSTPIAHASAGVLDCAGWPLPASYPPHRLQVGLHRNVMVANPTHDPATPLTAALSVWMQIPDARLLIADVDGHQSLILSQCAYRTQLRFFGEVKAPESVTLCPK